MKKDNRIASEGNRALNLNRQDKDRDGIVRILSRLSWLNVYGKVGTVAAGIVIVVLIFFSSVAPPPAAAQLGSPTFANPKEISSRRSEKRLRAVIEIINGNFSVPGGRTDQYRQYRGWDAATPRPTPPPDGAPVSPGPTLRTRLGDQVQIAFLNKVDETQFPYSPVHDGKPGFSDFGCDKVGVRTPPLTGRYHYPWNDKYPNCFHGSSTANLHFHGTHTSPDGLGDNVLVQVRPHPAQPDWTASFNRIFDSRKIPQKWSDLPIAFRNAQKRLVREHDAAAAAGARSNGLEPPGSLLKKNQELIAAGKWPEYFIGAFPNFFDIPDYSSGKYKAGQAPGTHWYHAHKHGSTSLHIRNGLAGALIIESSQEGGYDHFIRKHFGWGDKYGEHEKIFVFQQYDPQQNLERRTLNTEKLLVNGQLTPTITMRPGEIQLWRLINATQGNARGIINAGTLTSNSRLFQATQFNFVQTAQDGVQFSPKNYKEQPYLKGQAPNGELPFGSVDNGLILAAGNRADLLVQAPQTAGRTTFKSGDTILFFVNVTGEPVTPEKSFPDTWAEMPKFLLGLRKPNPPHDIPNPGSPVKFQWEENRSTIGRIIDQDNPDPGAPPHFMINGKQFGETGPIVDQCMPLDGLQEWVLENYTSSIAHPFHIHINPFQIIEIFSPTQPNKSYAPKDNFIWQDVIAIPPAVINTDANGKVTSVVPGRVVIRQAYPDFAGTFVLHCHILAHEDRGMMQLVRIVPRNQYQTGCQGHIPDHH